MTLGAISACAVDLSAANESSDMPLQLEVSVNGRKIGLIGSFAADPDGHLSATRAELKNLGLRLEGAADDVPVRLDALKSLRYTYNAETQSVDIAAPDDLLLAKEIGPIPEERTRLPDETMSSLVINYSLVGSLYDEGRVAEGRAEQSIETLSLDARLSGPLGTLENSGYFGRGGLNDSPAVRLDTAWTISDPEEIYTLTAGDIINGGLAWTRPIRLGGVQVRRDFSTRPDLITAPMPTLRGSAAVPSSVDVYVDNVKSYSRDVEPGPFTVSNLPTINGSGSATVVVKDAMGHETRQQVSFYQTSSLLKQGLFDYSIEAGVARRYYGLRSFDYDGQPVGSVSLRYGYEDDVTLETHLEGGADLVNAGAGATFTIFDSAIVSAGASLSTSGDDTGGQGFLSLQTKVLGVGLNVSSQRKFGGYRDLASVLGARAAHCSSSILACDLDNFSGPEMQNSATLSFDIPDDNGSLSVSGVEQRGSLKSKIISASYSRPLIEGSSLVVSGFRELNSGDTGVFAGLSMPFGKMGQAQVGYQHAAGESGMSATYSKPVNEEPGSLGWHVSASEGASRLQSASLTYQGSAMKTEVRGDRARFGNRVLGTVDGSIVATDGGFFLANTITEGFAVVDAGAPGVDVLLENRKIATTRDDGKAIVPGLRPYQRNRIGIDSSMLPADMIAPDVSSISAPRGASGVAIDFKATSIADSAIVVFRKGDQFLPSGTRGTLKGQEEPFVIGYDGRAYLEHLEAENAVSIEIEGNSCEILIGFRPVAGRQQVIEAPPCD